MGEGGCSNPYISFVHTYSKSWAQKIQKLLKTLILDEFLPPNLMFIYAESTKFSKIFNLLLTVCTVVKSKLKISQNFVAFSEYMNFNINILYWGGRGDIPTVLMNSVVVRLENMCEYISKHMDVLLK